MDESQLLQLMRNLVRVGNVVSTSPDRARSVRVQFPDMDNMVSHDLRMLFRRTGQDQDAGGLPDLGDQVICLFLPNGDEEGYVLGSFYSDQDVPPAGDQGDAILWVTNGMRIRVNRDERSVSVTGARTLTAEASESASVTAPIVELVGNVTIKGDLTVTGRSMLQEGATIEGIDFGSHVHGGVESGPDTTGGPTG